MVTERWTEIERSFAVSPEVVLPTAVGVDGVARMGQAVEIELDALYFDTADFHLARRGFSLRRRTGGADEGWHLKLPRRGDARIELRRPLSRAVRTVPKVLIEPVRAAVRDHRPLPVARITTRRRTHPLLAADDTVLAHLSDDLVRSEQLHPRH